MPTNDSSTGGYLLPEATPSPLVGQSLHEFLQQVIVFITGMTPANVRPRWQSEPANIPNVGTVWCAFGIERRRADMNAYIQHFCDNQLIPPGPGHSELQRHEVLDIMCSFYDTGVNGQADAMAGIFRDGLEFSQNREVMFLVEMGLIECREARAVPSLLKQQWLYRVDVPWVVRRLVRRTYPILNILSSDITLKKDTGAPDQVITVTPETVLTSDRGLLLIGNDGGILGP